jgi:Predicted membrane protein
MIKILMDLLVFFRTVAPLLTSLLIFTLFFIVFASSVKKHSKVYYTVFSIPFFMYLIPVIIGWCGIEMTFSFIRVPVVGEIVRDYIHMGSLGHPLLIIIMYMGALNVRNPHVKKLMSIRKEISIISGFPVLTHSIVRVMNNFMPSLKFFTDNAEYMDNPRVTSVLGAGISSFSLVLGIVLLVLFIPLWVTSFDSVRKRMNAVKWKQLQRWSYALYALMFIHAIGIQAGGMISRNAAVANQPQRTEIVAGAPQNAQGERPAGASTEAAGNRGERPSGQSEARQGGAPSAAGNTASAQPAPPRGRAPSVGIADIKVTPNTRQYISIASLILIYGSYLFLRVRKARNNAKKKAERQSA